MSHKIIVDANVWIRYARAKNIRPLTERFDLYGITPYVNNYLLAEIFDALVENKWMGVDSAKKVIGFIRVISEMSKENAIYRLSPDSDDNYLFDIAIQNNCELIVSDDTFLLSFPLRPVRVYTSGWFLKHFPV